MSLIRFVQRYFRQAYNIAHALDDVGNPIGSKRMLWDFKDPKTLDEWMFASDRELTGSSWMQFERSSNGRAVLHGDLSTAVPVGTDYIKSGYSAIQSRKLDSDMFSRGVWDLYEYDAFEIKLRGDGRKYIAFLTMDGSMDEDVWHHFIYTRGGPYWETVTLPFKDFLFTSRGYIQDKEYFFATSLIKTIGILLTDRIDGPFRLEIDSICAVPQEFPNDPYHEEFQGDDYSQPTKFISKTHM